MLTLTVIDFSLNFAKFIKISAKDCENIAQFRQKLTAARAKIALSGDFGVESPYCGDLTLW